MKIARKVCWLMAGKITGSTIITRTNLWAFLPIILKEQYFKKYRTETKDPTAMPIAKYSYWYLEKE